MLVLIGRALLGLGFWLIRIAGPNAEGVSPKIMNYAAVPELISICFTALVGSGLITTGLGLVRLFQ